MDHSLTRTVAPTATPVSVSEAKAHLRVSHASDDTYITGLIHSAAKLLETTYGYSYCVQTWRFSCATFDREVIELPRPPLRGITSITYVDATGTTRTLASSAYVVDTDSVPGRIFPAYGTSWPTVRGYHNDVTITYTAGHDTCPYDVRQAVLLLVATWYSNRESVSEKTMTRIPHGVEALLGPDRIIPV